MPARRELIPVLVDIAERHCGIANTWAMLDDMMNVVRAEKNQSLVVTFERLYEEATRRYEDDGCNREGAGQGGTAN